LSGFRASMAKALTAMGAAGSGIDGFLLVGYSEPTIAALVGHTGRSVTSRYMHSADAVLLAAADAVANWVGDLLGGNKPAADVVPLRATR
jgi:hypothetical protein